MKVILLTNVPKLGRAHELKDVSDGYARNFLLPKKLARPATAGAVANEEERRKQAVIDAKERDDQNRVAAKRLSGLTIAIPAKAKDGKLFGSVGAGEIVSAIGTLGISGVTEKHIHVGKPFRETGVFSVSAGLGKEKAVFKISIEAS